MNNLNFRNSQFENLIKNNQKNLDNEKTRLLILENLVLRKQKNGKNYKNMAYAFDIESLRNKLTSLGLKIGCLYIDSGTDCFYIHLDNVSVRIDNKIYLSDLSTEKRAEIEQTKQIIRESYCSYYYLDTIEDYYCLIEKEIKNSKERITEYNTKLSKMNDLKSIVLTMINNVNALNCGFYGSDIQELFF